MNGGTPVRLPTATIVLHREWAYADSLRRYTVLVDGKRLGMIAADEERRFIVSPGSHVVALRLAFSGRSRRVSVDLVTGSEVHLRCRAASSAQNVLAMFKPSAYIDLTRRPDEEISFE